MSASKYIRLLMVAGLMAGAAGHAAAQADEQAARILRLDLQGRTTSGELQNLQGENIPQYQGSVYRANGAVLASVFWVVTSRPLPPGTLVTFEYRQQFYPDVRCQHQRYTDQLSGQIKTDFTIPEQALRVHGPLTGWRARVLAPGGRLLAERASENWR